MHIRPSILVLLILLGHAGAVSAQNDPLTLEDIVTLKQVVSAVLSPSGEHIAYGLSVPRIPYVDDDGGAYRELHIADLEGNSRGFITGEVNIGQIDWSVDSETVYYLAERNDDDEFRALYGIPLAGGESQRLYSHDANIQSFYPSPDGRHIAFLATEAATRLSENSWQTWASGPWCTGSQDGPRVSGSLTSTRTSRRRWRPSWRERRAASAGGRTVTAMR